MGTIRVRDYKWLMLSLAASVCRTRLPRAAYGLLFVASACGSSNPSGLFPGGAGGGAGTSQDGGEGADSTSGEAGMGGAHAGSGGPSQAGALSSAGSSGFVAPPSCAADADCSDGIYCNGSERCVAYYPGAELKFCARPLIGPCPGRSCDETGGCDDCTDEDGDNFLVEGCTPRGKPFDCDDTDKQRFQTNTEVCEPVGDEPDLHDEDCRDETIGARDRDGDRHTDWRCGNALSLSAMLPEQASALIEPRGTDCDDDDPDRNPGNEEVCDNKDNDCDGDVDEVFGLPKKKVNSFFEDRDGDGHGDPNSERLTQCSQPPPGYVDSSLDCNDEKWAISPHREEICNGVDDDCDGTTDQPLAPGALLSDEPFDGVTTYECTGADGWVIRECPPGRHDCGDRDYRDACETPRSLCNCSVCGDACVFSCGETGCEAIDSVSLGGFHSCAVVLPAGRAPGPAEGAIACWGSNEAGQLGIGGRKRWQIPVLVPEFQGARAVSVGRDHTCAIDVEERLWCWGSDDYGKLGVTEVDTGEPAEYPLAVNKPTAYTRAKQVTAGIDHTCAIYDEGHLLCWGRGERGQLGDGVAEPGRIQVLPRPARREAEYIADAKQVALGIEHTCVLTTVGGVECWGSNELGQLGVGSAALTGFDVRAIAGPVDLPGSVAEIRAGALHTCARIATRIYCWGYNGNYELGHGGESEGLPVEVDIPDAQALAAAEGFACALTTDGEVYCWGSNSHGQRGQDAASELPPEPTRVSIDTNGSPIVELSAGESRACVRTLDGLVRCWGRNHRGQLGNGEGPEQSHEPTELSPLSGSRGCVP